MKISREDIEKLLLEAFKAASLGIDKESFLDTVRNRFAKEDDNIDKEFRIYSLEEIRAIKPGSVFEHSKYGLARFEVFDGELICFFEGPSLAYARVETAGAPWNLPIRQVNPNRWNFKYV